jgi:hypothetical protein
MDFCLLICGITWIFRLGSVFLIFKAKEDKNLFDYFAEKE